MFFEGLIIHYFVINSIIFNTFKFYSSDNFFTMYPNMPDLSKMDPEMIKKSTEMFKNMSDEEV